MELNMFATHPVTAQASTSEFLQHAIAKAGSCQNANSRWPSVKQRQLKLICHQIARLQDENASATGWLLVIAPPALLTKSLLVQLGISSRRILMIQQKQINHYDNLMRDALTCSTCSAVLSFLPIDHPHLYDYQYLSQKYGTDFYNLADLPDIVAH
jgi:cell division inhibitor SulA